MKPAIKEEHSEYYKWLEFLRLTGITNMYGARPYLERQFGLSKEEAADVLYEWMTNYDELADKYGW